MLPKRLNWMVNYINYLILDTQNKFIVNKVNICYNVRLFYFLCITKSLALCNFESTTVQHVSFKFWKFFTKMWKRYKSLLHKAYRYLVRIVNKLLFIHYDCKLFIYFSSYCNLKSLLVFHVVHSTLEQHYMPRGQSDRTVKHNMHRL